MFSSLFRRQFITVSTSSHTHLKFNYILRNIISVSWNIFHHNRYTIIIIFFFLLSCNNIIFIISYRLHDRMIHDSMIHQSCLYISVLSFNNVFIKIPIFKFINKMYFKSSYLKMIVLLLEQKFFSKSRLIIKNWIILSIWLFWNTVNSLIKTWMVSFRVIKLYLQNINMYTKNRCNFKIEKY